MGTIASKVNKTVMQKYERIQAPIFENQLGDLIFFTGDSSVIYAADAFTHYAWPKFTVILNVLFITVFVLSEHANHILNIALKIINLWNIKRVVLWMCYNV